MRAAGITRGREVDSIVFLRCERRSSRELGRPASESPCGDQGRTGRQLTTPEPPGQRSSGSHSLRRARRAGARDGVPSDPRSEEHTSELQSRQYLVCRLLLEKKKQQNHLHLQRIYVIDYPRRHLFTLIHKKPSPLSLTLHLRLSHCVRSHRRHVRLLRVYSLI